MQIEFIAATPMGIEALATRELKDLGYADVRAENGRVSFTGDETSICRANLWLRTADRIQIKLGEFTATTFEELFQGTRALPWDEWISRDGNFVIEGKSHLSQLTSVPACQSVVEKAIVERLKTRYKIEWFPKTGARYTVQVALLKDRATLTIDTTGPSLHKRGYRPQAAVAPIKETLAAAMILLSRWHPERAFMDPFCGSGTIPIEAAMIGHNMAPGLRRSFAAEGWDRVPKSAWKDARDEALDLAKMDQPVEIWASDRDSNVLEMARSNIKDAGVGKSIKLWQRDVAEIHSEIKYGYLITNPPYGERLGETLEVEALYRTLGKVTKRLDGWSVFVITAHQGFERMYGRGADKKRKLYNGRIECHLYQFQGPYHARPVPYG